MRPRCVGANKGVVREYPLRSSPPGPELGSLLEEVYGVYHRPEYIHPDPLEFPRMFDDPLDREIAALVSSSLAYGNVRAIRSSLSAVFCRMGSSPRRFVEFSSRGGLEGAFSGFRHRFTGDAELVDFLWALGRVVEGFGSLKACFLEGFNPADPDVFSALGAFTSKIAAFMRAGKNSLLPCPGSPSACKRLNLFLRWMVRHDEIDPGGWPEVPKSSLVVPLDVHMHAIGLRLGLIRRRSADRKAALEMTDALRNIDPNDPVRFDFSLTRIGMRRLLGRLTDAPCGTGRHDEDIPVGGL